MDHQGQSENGQQQQPRDITQERATAMDSTTPVNSSQPLAEAQGDMRGLDINQQARGSYVYSSQSSQNSDSEVPTYNLIYSDATQSADWGWGFRLLDDDAFGFVEFIPVEAEFATEQNISMGTSQAENMPDMPGFSIEHWFNSYMMPIFVQSDVNSGSEVPTSTVQEGDDTPVTVSDCPDLNTGVANCVEVCDRDRETPMEPDVSPDTSQEAETAEAPKDLPGFPIEQQPAVSESSSDGNAIPNSDQSSLNDTPDDKPSPACSSRTRTTGTYCDLCERNYSRPSELTRHNKRLHLSQRNNICQYCGYRCFEKSGLKNHACGAVRKRFNCKSCGTRFRYHYELNEHVRGTCKKVDEGNKHDK